MESWRPSTRGLLGGEERPALIVGAPNSDLRPRPQSLAWRSCRGGRSREKADGKAGEEEPEKPQGAGAAGGPEEEAEKPVKTKTVSSSNGGESSSRSAEERSAEEEAADLPTKPTKISKFGFAIGSQTTKKASAISIKLGSSKPKETVPTLAPKTLSVAAAFNEDEDSEPEEMPPEAKMRMKNIGRDTPTSAGPNSFNKGKHGFSDNQKLWERNIKSHLGNVHDQDN
ncbi:PEST proteolytic signal-containing nuclear protein-like [Sciurus carolinensis]|uniref:PEST proteolytic signal-containing nuclear protein-like n=1 Tax=Sciurus carolinensis TaxID=30640 RepID=UPI001FB47F5E|nr:PEST proteolytic signal-containing nuclear protein-like [Sciurus carolinensis]